jgi:RNA polymerase sigma factor (sigma-70 family)
MEMLTAQIHAKLERMRNGDKAAREELLRGVAARLEKLTRRMLKDYPRVQRWADTGDVQQNAVMRLLRALETITPETTRDFFNLAAVQIRRELIDMARHFSGPRGTAPQAPAANDSTTAPAAPLVVQDPDLETWAQFHLEVERLATEEREVVSLIYYHGWEQREVAELFGVHVRTVRRWWHAALTKLRAVLKGVAEP